MGGRLLILETAGHLGQLALAADGQMLQKHTLDEARRHARDLAPAVGEMLKRQGWQVRDLEGVIVSRGPGSYTGLRVGIMSAKTLAYAAGCALVAVDTFAAIACQAPPEAGLIDVVADAQQDKVYCQRFARSQDGADLAPAGPLAIRPLAEWLGQLGPTVWVSGPGLRGQESRLPAGQPVVAARLWDPRLESLLAIGWHRFQRGDRDDFWTVEPLYLRPSAAEENWPKKGRGCQP